MQAARRALNGMARASRGLVARAPDEAVLAAGKVVHRALGGGHDLPDLANWQATTIRDAMSLILQAIEETPHGVPLQFNEPLFVTLSTSRYCPVGCANCYSSSSMAVAEKSEDRFLSNVRQVAESRTPIVAILGGEPFLHPGLLDAVSILTDAGKSVSVATNWKIRDEQLRQLHDPRTVSLLLSLWGNKSKHDKLRGQGSYDRILANARLAKQHGLKASLLIVINDDDPTILDEAENVLRRETFDVVQITRKIEVGRLDRPGLAARIHVDDLRERVKSFRGHCRQIIIDLPELRPPRVPGRLSRLFGIAPFTGCGAGSWLWHIDSQGQGHACPVAEGAVARSVGPGDEFAPKFLEAWQSRKFQSDKGQAGCRFETTK